ncbi:MAG: hypothetical protein HQL63_04030 [Magnetococcales bacterium]|nr:hypothetical protein [Magnetococcales bacterium]MBF0321756.1 hypothetical protein [Magnetococcales bacterium]
MGNNQMVFAVDGDMDAWGSRRFQMCIPEQFLDLSLARRYCPGHNASVREADGYLILDYFRNEDGGKDWKWGKHGQGRMIDPALVRTDLIRGDLRVLYLGWLLAAQEGVLSNDSMEPPLPVGLADMNGPLLSFVDFFGIGWDLIEAAASSHDAFLQPPSREEMVSKICAKFDYETACLVCVASKGNPPVGLELLRRLAAVSRKKSPSSKTTDHRNVGHILALAKIKGQKRDNTTRDRKWGGVNS